MVEITTAAVVSSSILMVFVPAFARELHASRQAEATLGIAKIAAGAVEHAAEKHDNGALPASAPLTPSSVPRGAREVDAPGAWDHPTWQALGFRAFGDGVPHAYAFAFESSREAAKWNFRALAHGDLDGDGTTSSFELRGVIDDDAGARIDPAIGVAAELE